MSEEKEGANQSKGKASWREKYWRNKCTFASLPNNSTNDERHNERSFNAIHKQTNGKKDWQSYTLTPFSKFVFPTDQMGESDRERECVCVLYVSERERERETACVSVCVWDCKSECLFVCVFEREAVYLWWVILTSPNKNWKSPLA